MSPDTIIRVLTYLWIGIALIAIPYGLYVVRDARRDVIARKVAGINGGREALARLVVTTGALMSFAFIVFLAVGAYAVLPHSIPRTWGRLVVPAGLVLAEAALAAAMIITQRVRQGVLVRDMASEQTRILAAATLAAEHLDANTASNLDVAAALRDSAEATRAMTHELGNGPLAASLASTVAIDKLTEATSANTASHKTEVGANTDAVAENTAVTQENTEARQNDG